MITSDLYQIWSSPFQALTSPSRKHHKSSADFLAAGLSFQSRKLQTHNLMTSWSFMSSSNDESFSDVNSIMSSTPENGKAILTFDTTTNMILTSNRNCCLLMNEEKLSSFCFDDFFRKSNNHGKKSLMQNGVDENQIQGHVVELVRRDDVIVPVSMCMKRRQNRCLVIFEPVARVHSDVIIASDGTIQSFDDNFRLIFQNWEIHGEKCFQIKNLIPKIQLDNFDRKQFLSAISNSGSFPITLHLHNRCDVTGDIEVRVTLYSAIGGFLTIQEDDDVISDVNDNFSSTLLGFRFEEIKNKKVEEVLPDYRQLRHQINNGNTSSVDENLSPVTSSIRKINMTSSPLCKRGMTSSPMMSSPMYKRDVTSSPMTSSTPVKRKSEVSFICNTFIRHKDESLLPVTVEMKNGKKFGEKFLWINFDLNFVKSLSTANLTTSLDDSLLMTSSSVNTTNDDVTDNYDASCEASYDVTNNDVTIGTEADDEVSNSKCRDVSVEVIDDVTSYGEISNFYSFDKILGKGGFGFVRSAKHMTSSTRVTVKFVDKTKMRSDCYVIDDGIKIPSEVYFLRKLRHQNIVDFREFFQTETHFALVMTSLGDDVIDLFDFIDISGGQSDEFLSSFIFRQVASAVDYLNSKKIIHRDIKDENIIINSNFVCQLIDFGTASSFEKDEKFEVFWGTPLYSAPETLTGNPYSGPPLEVWSLGVTLFTLIFGENPFETVDEISEFTRFRDLSMSFVTSHELMDLLENLLEVNVEKRFSIDDVISHAWLTQPVDVTKFSWKEITSRSTDDHCTHDVIAPLTRQLENVLIL